MSRDALVGLEGALDTLVASDVQAYSDAASIEVLHRELTRLEAFVTEAVSAFEAGEEWAADGARTAAAWIATRCRVPRSSARRRVRLGRTLQQLPACAEAWREGRIGSDQAKAIAGARRHRTEAAMERDEPMLVDQAARMGFEDFYRALSYWKQLADPEGADDLELERRAARQVYLEESIGGMWLGQMTLDPISGSIVAGELNRLEHELFEVDCAEARERLGRTPRLDELARTSGQRRADALVEMATRSRTAPLEGTRPAPLFSVFVGYETLHGRICELENGTVVAPSALDPWIGSAYFERAIFRLGNRIDVSVRARLFSGGTRRAIELRDRMCTHPYCYEPAEYCEGDHIEPWSQGGPTTQENGRLLCGFHNRLRNQQQGRRTPR
ncbi:MAG TPA: DUF222 domain-containing protein, partial [Acidimicrobiales bacterium]|nr:DUF222 domain-containing protein [Acidimicrobiales bacterium]